MTPDGPRRPRSTGRRRPGDLGDAVRSYTGDVDFRELPGLWQRDLRRAHGLLTREQPRDEDEAGPLRRAWSATTNLFVGITEKLTPARRILFAASLLLVFFGLGTDTMDVAGETITVFEDPALLLLAIVGFVLLLVLELADRVAVKDELEVARELQRSLLPTVPPVVTGYRFAFSSTTANTVGGDYYDFLPLDENRVALVCADASGHGVASALLMAIAHTTLRLAATVDPSPGNVAAMMNTALLSAGGPRSFLTLFYGVLEPATGRLDYVCAGHPYPLLRRTSGEIESLGTGSLPTGLRRHFEPVAGHARVEVGDLLVLYSDGIPEAVDRDGELFGFERLEEIVADGGSAREVHDRVLAAIDARIDRDAPRDDRSLVVIERRPPQPS